MERLDEVVSWNSVFHYWTKEDWREFGGSLE